MTFSYSTNRDLAQFLTEPMTPGQFLSAIDSMLGRTLAHKEFLDISDTKWAEDVAANAVRFAWKVGAPRPAVTLHQLRKDGRARIHFQVPLETP